MHTQRTIFLSGLRKSDEMVFSSLLSLLSSTTDEQWRITNEGVGEIVVVDIDVENGLRIAHRFERIGKKVIRLTNHSDARGPGLWLHKPLRSAEIVKCISALNQSDRSMLSKNIICIDRATVVSLNRWPNREILKSYPGANRLSALMRRSALTLKQISELSNQSYEDVAKFAEACIRLRYLDVLTDKSTVQSISTKTSTAKISQLFSRLRSKFSGRQ